ncbi:MAG: apolipoprotein N-acyltransferase [Gammaproteobacteria bacterium]
MGDFVVLLAGLLMPLAYAPFDFYPLPLAALAVLFLVWDGRSPRQALRAGWLFGAGMFGAGVYWVYISVYVYGHAPLGAAIGVTLLLVAYLALFPAALGYGVSRWFPGGSGSRLLLVLPAGWMLLEWVRGWLFTGFPWLDLGYSQLDGPLGGLAPVAGVYGVSWATALSAGLLAFVATSRGRRRWGALTAAALLWAAAYGLGGIRWTAPTGAPLKVSLVQGNVPQNIKWDPKQQVATIERYIHLTSGHWNSALVVWPETAIPAFYYQVEDTFVPGLRDEAEQHHAELLTGVPVLDRKSWKYYNAVVAIGKSHGFYYKQHLVPFGEYLPLRDVLGHLLDFMPVPMSDFSAGRPDQPLLRVRGYPVGVSICYEIAFNSIIRQTVPAAAWLVTVSDDAWFGNSLAPHQLLEMARMRARETGRYLLRATNTGISAIIGPAGRVLKRGPQFKEAVIDGTIVPLKGATPYVRMGNGPLMGAAFAALIGAAWWRRRRGTR